MIVGSLSLDPYVKLRQGPYRFLLLENAVSLEPANTFFRLEMLQGEMSLYSLHPHPCGEGQTTPKTLLSFHYQMKTPFSFLAWSNVILHISCKSKQEMPQSICFLIIVNTQENKRKTALQYILAFFKPSPRVSADAQLLQISHCSPNCVCYLYSSALRNLCTRKATGNYKTNYMVYILQI